MARFDRRNKIEKDIYGFRRKKMKCEHCNDDFDSVKEIIKHLKKEFDKADKRNIKIENMIESLHHESKELDNELCNIEALIEDYSKLKLEVK